MRAVKVLYKSLTNEILEDGFVGPNLSVTFSKGESVTLFVGRKNGYASRERDNAQDIPVDMLAIYAPGEWIKAQECSAEEATELEKLKMEMD